MPGGTANKLPQRSQSEKDFLAKSLPRNLDAERCCLGAIILDNQYLTIAAERLVQEDFFLPQHFLIFSHMLELNKKGIPIETISLVESLQAENELEAAGGVAYLSQLTDGLPKLSNVDYYCGLIKDKAILRRMIYTANAVQEQAAAAAEEPNVVLERAKKALDQITDDSAKGGFVSIKSVISNSYARMEKIFNEGRGVTGLQAGYTGLDNQLGGLQDGELTVLAARPSQGKTALALNIAENVAVRSKSPVGLFSMEMSKESLLFRLLSSVGRIDGHKFRTGHFNRDDWDKIKCGLADLGEAPIWIDDDSSPTIQEIAARAHRMKREHGLALLIVDYLQLIVSTDSKASRQEKVSEISRGLKRLAKDLHVPIIALAQLSRRSEQEKRRPILSDLRESGGTEQEADVVLFIHRPKFYDNDAPDEERCKAEIIIAKQRNGPTGILNFVFLARHTRFEEAIPDIWAGISGDE